MTTITPIHTGSVTVNGAQLAYDLAGAGTPLLLLHRGARKYLTPPLRRH